MNIDNSTDQLWDLELSCIPNRSRLFHLKPIGMGTPYVESLTSYITRLAEAHSVPVGILILSEIAPLVKKGFVFDDSTRRELDTLYPSCRFSSNTLNGSGTWATNLVPVLESLSGRSDLSYLTLINIAELLSQRKLLKRFKAWCPICFQESYIAGQPISEPLIWAFNEVTFCSHHYQQLQTQCPFCKKQIPFLGWKSRLGYCSKCQSWLGLSKKNELLDPKFALEEMEWQLGVIKNIGDLIANIPNLLSQFDRDSIRKIFLTYVKIYTDGNINNFAKLIGQKKITVQQWCNGRNIPMLSKLLEVCQKLEVSLVDFLSVKIISSEYDNVKDHQESNYKEKKLVAVKNDDLLTIENKITAILLSQLPSSLQQLRISLGLKSNSILYQYFPKETHQIVLNYRNYCNKKKLDFLRSELERALENEEYPPPTLIEISKKIGQNNTNVLYKNFPELCYAITAKHSFYRKESAKKNTEAIRQQIKDAAFSIHAKGQKPHSVNVGKLLTKPGLMRDKRAITALYEVLQELGYISDKNDAD
ncbi:TniQ family protein [Nostoc sp.]|uniref:TniQ family protein n=1 Tax=Nostoc sp. TaxID=1180 RepID=UPI002FFA2C9D